MEEILASIRRIIADDQQAKPAPAAAPPEPTIDEDDVLDLAEVAPPVAKAPPPLEEVSFDDLDFDAIEVEPEPPRVPEPEPEALPEPEPEPAFAAFEAPEPEPEPPPVQPARERLISQNTDASVNQAFNMLAHTVLTHNARTLEDLVSEMLRPMLKVWLDDNLPAMVERLVRAEIERVARGRP